MEDKLVSATEVASYVYCPEAWRLEKGLGYEPSAENKASRSSGIAQHQQWTNVDRSTSSGLRFAVLILLGAALAWLLLWAMS